MSILHDIVDPQDYGTVAKIRDGLNKWPSSFMAGLRGWPLDGGETDRILAWETGRALREGMERMEVEPPAIDWSPPEPMMRRCACYQSDGQPRPCELLAADANWFAPVRCADGKWRK